ncbi:hypothetical protein [Jatrophihabitans sp.]|uniref:hypothetical protein n=1 Tax=Jatrophihabitans sp. TaxID=1932789 RepID=UPI0030C65977|nr:hypothetical protein [Jatrophihabitans sp.]
MSDVEIVIHLRDAAAPLRIALPAVPAHEAEADRQVLLYDLEEARQAEVPLFAVQTRSGFPAEPLVVDPAAVTEIDLADAPTSPTD